MGSVENGGMLRRQEYSITKDEAPDEGQIGELIVSRTEQPLQK